MLTADSAINYTDGTAVSIEPQKLEPVHGEVVGVGQLPLAQLDALVSVPLLQLWGEH